MTNNHDPNLAVPSPVKEPTVEEKAAISGLHLDERYSDDAVTGRVRQLTSLNVRSTPGER